MFKLEELKKIFFLVFSTFFISTGNTFLHTSNTYANEKFLEGNTLYNKYLKNKYQIDNLIGLEDFYVEGLSKNESNNPYLKEGDSFFIETGFFSNASVLISEITSPFQGIFLTFRLI